MGFFSKIVKAVTAPIRGTISSVQSLAKGDLKGSVSALIQGGIESLDPITSSVLGINQGSGGGGGSTGDPATDFARKQYEDWQAIYGPIQDNLGSYYTNLTPSYYARQGIESYQTEWQNAIDEIDTMFKQGSVSKDAADSMKRDAKIEQATEKAQIRRDAQQQVQEQQLNFLSTGSGNQAAGNLQNALNNQSQVNRQNANAAAQARANTASSLVTGLGSLLQTGLNSYNGGG